MPSDSEAIGGLVRALRDAGFAVMPTNTQLNPCRIELRRPDSATWETLVVHSRRITRQGLQHNRPADELHAQMIFDGDQRGRGVVNHLRGGGTRLLLGYYPVHPTRVWVAFDPSQHEAYAYSKSLQVKQGTLDDAALSGIIPYRRNTGETIVAFREDVFPQYLETLGDYHTLAQREINAIHEATEATPTAVLPALDTMTGPRQRLVSLIARLRRDARFSRAIRSAYPQCAMCDLPGPELIEGAHIIPVTDPASADHYANGLGLCPLCHRLYDGGLVLIDGQGVISVNERRIVPGSPLAQRLQEWLRAELWQPNDPSLQPSASNLDRTFRERRG